MKVLLIAPPEEHMLQTQVSEEIAEETGFKPSSNLLTCHVADVSIVKAVKS